MTIDATGNDNSVEYPAATIDEISPTNLLRSAMKDQSATKGIEKELNENLKGINTRDDDGESLFDRQ
jgi:hypothetical protein